jgi:hypothetical protein
MIQRRLMSRRSLRRPIKSHTPTTVANSTIVPSMM